MWGKYWYTGFVWRGRKQPGEREREHLREFLPQDVPYGEAAVAHLLIGGAL